MPRRRNQLLLLCPEWANLRQETKRAMALPARTDSSHVVLPLRRERQGYGAVPGGDPIKELHEALHKEQRVVLQLRRGGREAADGDRARDLELFGGVGEAQYHLRIQAGCTHD